MRKFDVGDRVRVNGEYYRLNNAAGTIIGFNRSTGNPCIEFDERMGGHTGGGYCSGRGKDGHCWFVPTDMVILSPICNCNTLGCEGGCNEKV